MNDDNSFDGDDEEKEVKVSSLNLGINKVLYTGDKDRVDTRRDIFY